ncbi:MAG: radical SAM protein [Alphaproteobacteria bacterium]|nr:radical SAM protein [Alphaproteobacteria bacterium]
MTASSDPTLPFLHLDTLWLQVTGTVCNIACRHCFISCGPKVRIHDLMTVDQCRAAIDAAAAHGCRAYAFTGGEPFLHPDILALVDLALARGPLDILSNGMLIDEPLAQALARRFREAPHGFDVRISLDGLSAEENDPVRGRGVFDATVQGIRNLVAAGMEPVVAVTTVHADHESAQGRQAFYELLRGLGVAHPRVKLIPPFRIGREARRSGGYGPLERLTAAMIDDDSPWVLQCGTSRMVTNRGAWPCPILVNDDGARMGDRLDDALRPCTLGSPACHTCHVEGFSCRT